MNSKTCTKCLQEKQITEFYNRAASIDGKALHCKQCAAIYNARWRNENKDILKIKKAEYHANNREEILRKHRIWMAENIESVKQKQLEYRNKNKEKARINSIKWRLENTKRSRDSSKRWRSSNKDRYKAINKRFLQNNPGIKISYEENRRARKLSLSGEVSRDIVPRLLKSQKHLCACCKADLVKNKYHLDHIMPLKLGGAHTDHNMQILCVTCNLKKSAKHPIEFMQDNGFLL